MLSGGFFCFQAGDGIRGLIVTGVQTCALPISSVSVAFGCPYEGAVPPERVAEVAAALADDGIEEISLADTIGVANPAQVEALFQTMKERLPAVRWGAHFHDTRGTAMANLLSALETGVNLFEGSVGGIGGSPFAPGAAGNLC